MKKLSSQIMSRRPRFPEPTAPEEEPPAYDTGYGRAYADQEPLLPEAEPYYGAAPVPLHGTPACPPGLEYLTRVDQLLVHQQVEILEVLTGWETSNRYDVKNSLGQKILAAKEESSIVARNCMGNKRPFELKLFDNEGREVLRLCRPLRCGVCCFPCCLQELEVQAPPGNVIGHVKQQWSLCQPLFFIQDSSHTNILRIEGPPILCGSCTDVNFNLLTNTGMNIGKVSKQWAGFLKEMFTDADNFGVNFPIDLDVKVKATVLAATFLIDFMYYEDSGKDRHR